MRHLNRLPAPANPSATWRRGRALLAAGVLGVASLTALSSATASNAAPSTAAADAAHSSAHAHDVIANLFEWNWASVARECTSVLGPKGYGGVQVAPPADSLSRTGPAPVHPWWEVYQPVTYQLNSRMGTEAQFRTMVSTCRGAGVKVYVDAVINHMTGQGDTSYGGVHYSKYAYQGLYTPADFHNNPADCPVAAGNGDQNGTIADFNNVTQVTNCELVGLSDLRTETAVVRDRIAA